MRARMRVLALHKRTPIAQAHKHERMRVRKLAHDRTHAMRVRKHAHNCTHARARMRLHEQV